MAKSAPRKAAAKAPAKDGEDEDDLDVRPEDDIEMTFFEHLGELRARLTRALWGVVPGIAIAWTFKEQLLQILVQPLRDAWRAQELGEPELHFANPIDPFVGYLKLSIVCGLIFSSPWLFWQLWSFIAPGLYRREKRMAIPFVLASTLFFAGGAFFGYMYVFPLIFETLLSFAGTLPNHSFSIQPTIMFEEYLGFATRMLLAYGVTFEVPVVVSFLALAEIVNWKQLLKFSRWWVLISSIVAAILTPPDPGSQIMMLVPLVILYFLSILVAYFLGPTPPPEEKKEDEEEEEEEG